MLTQQLNTEQTMTGPCADCGLIVSRRIACVDEVTHSRMELCEMCWRMFRQRQVFADGCCG